MSKTALVLIRREPMYRKDAIDSGFSKLGFQLVKSPNPKPGSVVCVWNRKPQDEAVCQQYEQAGGKVVVVENSYLCRERKAMYSLSLGGHNGSGYSPVGDEDRFGKLGYEVKPWRHNPEGHILVIQQRGIGKPGMASPPAWAEQQAEKFKRLGRKVKLRPHPGENKPRTTVEQDLEGAAFMHIWSSGCGVLALVEGYPVVYNAPHWICEQGGTRGWNNPGYGDVSRAAALHRMSHSQWHHDEIKTGEPLARLLGL